jgi:hypothetical protein
MNGNRLPDYVAFTHPHLDHTGGLDTLVIDNRRHFSEQQRQLPDRLRVLMTEPCWRELTKPGRFDYLERDMDWRVLRPGQPRVIEGTPFTMRAFPVYHGEYAPGASIFAVECQGAKAIFSWDLLCPLLRQRDLDYLSNADVLYVDCNTRHPWPRSGHWSLSPNGPNGAAASALLDWTTSHRGAPWFLSRPHLQVGPDDITASYIDEFLREQYDVSTLYWSICEFAQRVRPRKIMLVHFSGWEDAQHYGIRLPSDKALLRWAQRVGQGFGIDPAVWGVPLPGDLLRLC